MFSALEVTLISVLAALVFVAVVYITLMTRNLRNRQQLFDVLADEVVEGGITFVGDSITDFYPMQEFFPGRLIYNQGIAADTTKGVLQRLHKLYRTNPRKVFLQIGTNDIGHLNRPSKVAERIQLIIKNIKENLPETELNVISLYPVTHRKMWLSIIIAGFRTKKKLKKVNSLVAEICEAEEVNFINMFPLLANHKDNMELKNTLDGIHCSAIGYRVISDELTKHID